MSLTAWPCSKKILLVITTICLGSCAVNYNYPSEPKGNHCKPMVLPELPPIPEVPYISPSDAKSRDKSDDILVAKIKELREHSKRVKQAVEEAHREHLKSCQ